MNQDSSSGRRAVLISLGFGIERFFFRSRAPGSQCGRMCRSRKFESVHYDMATLFISYAHEDTEFVNKLASDLTTLGYNVIQDTKTFRPSFTIDATIRNRIARSDFLLPVLTEHAAESAWVTGVEVKLARELQKQGRALRIIPILLSVFEGQDKLLHDVNYLDFTDPQDYALALARLVAELPHRDYDELINLRQELDSLDVEGRTLLALLRRASKKRLSWDGSSAEDLVQTINPMVKSFAVLDAAYWWLIVFGVLRFKGIDEWWDEEEYFANSMEFAEIAPRGIALLNELRTEP